MIKKLICLIWGCKFVKEVFTGQYGTAFHPLWGQDVQVPIVRTEKYAFCPRCGKNTH